MQHQSAGANHGQNAHPNRSNAPFREVMFRHPLLRLNTFRGSMLLRSVDLSLNRQNRFDIKQHVPEHQSDGNWLSARRFEICRAPCLLYSTNLSNTA